MGGEVAQVGQDEPAHILMSATAAAKNLGAQLDHLLQLRRRLRQRIPGDDDVGGVEGVTSGIHKIYSTGLYHAARYLTACLEIAAENVERATFSIATFPVIPNEQLYGVLLSQWHTPRPTAQVQAFARIESAYYAVMLSLEHHLPRCVELLVGLRPPFVLGDPVRTMIGYSDDRVTAANEYVCKRDEAGFPVPERAPTAAATGKPPRPKSSVDVDQALSYLHRACSLTSLAAKNMDVAIAFISGFLDPEEVAEISERVDEHANISEDGPYPCPSDDLD